MEIPIRTGPTFLRMEVARRGASRYWRRWRTRSTMRPAFASEEFLSGRRAYLPHSTRCAYNHRPAAGLREPRIDGRAKEFFTVGRSYSQMTAQTQEQPQVAVQPGNEPRAGKYLTFKLGK